MSSLTVNNGFPQDPHETAEKIRAALRCGRAGCACQRGSNVHCPVHDDEIPSLSVSERDGKVLVFCHGGCPSRDVIAVLRARGLWPTSRTGAGEPVHRTRYELRGPDGRLLAVHVREDLPGGRKRFWWEGADGTRGLDGMRPVDLLFGLERLPHHPGEPVVLVEGEKAASALQQAGILAVGTVCGAAATPSEAVLRHLVGRRVILWRDRDEIGHSHMLRIAEILHRLGHRDIRLVEPPEDVPEGWDAADAIAEGRDVRAIIEGAQPYNPTAVGVPGRTSPRILTAAEFLEEAESPEPEWVVDGLVPSGGVVLLVGRPKSGKSTLARTLAVAVAQGRPFLGRGVRQGAVLLISLEDRPKDAARHLRSLGLQSSDPLLVSTGPVEQDLLRGWVQEHRPVLVIVDTLGRVLRLKDSTEYSQVLEALDGLLQMARKSGAALLLIHHAPKLSDDRDPIDAPLGSVAFAGTADVVFHLKRGRDGVRTLASVQRVGQDLEESVVVVGSDGWPTLVGTRREVQAAALEQALLETLRVRGEAITRELLEAVEGEWRLKLRALQALVEKGQIHREGTGKRGDPFRYRLPETGDSLFRCGIGIPQRSNEIQIRPESAPGLDESAARYSAQNDGVPQRIRGSSATNLTPEGEPDTPWPPCHPAPGSGTLTPEPALGSGTPPATPSGPGNEDPKGLLEPLSGRGEAWGSEEAGEEAQTMTREEEPPPEPPPQEEEAIPSGSPGASNGPLPREVLLVADPSGWERALRDLHRYPVVGLDAETYGDTRHPHIRLVQIGTPERIYVANAFRFDPVPALRSFLEAYQGEVVLHNAKFDLRALGFIDPCSWPGDWLPVDTMLVAQILANGEVRKDRPSVVFPSLQETVRRWLGVELPKDLQRSDWAGDITGEQLRYAAADAAILVPLWGRLKEELEKAGLVDVFELERRALPSVVWLEASGAPFDKDMWAVLANEAEARAKELERALLEAAGKEFNPRSPKQVLELLKERGVNLPDTRDSTLDLAKDRDPLIPLLLEYRDALKRASTYGLEWAEKHVDQDGRVRSDFQQIGAISGRLSSARPNLQNIPRDPRYRACFKPAQGRVLVKADYNQIELRAAAAFMDLLYDDRSLAEAFRRGEDIHSLVAREVLGIPSPTKEDRQRAKAISFGQLYGQSVEGFRRYAETHGVKFAPEEAHQVLDRFFRLFPGFQKARAWAYSRHFETMDAIYTLGGRRILNPAAMSPQERLNLPVQGSAADGLKAALGLLWERRSELPEGACPVLCVHDELVIECRREDAEEVVRVVQEVMTEGMQRILKTVPVMVEATVCQDWSGTPVEQEEVRKGGNSEMKLEDATEFLKDVLGRGPVPVEEILEKAAERGLSRRTLFRAREHLGVRSQRRDGKWWWRLPDAVKEWGEPDEVHPAQDSAVEGPGKDLEDEAPSGDPITEQPHLGGAASEESRAEELRDTEAGRLDLEALTTEGGQVELEVTDVQNGPSGAHGEALDPRALVARISRLSPGPHHLVGGWTLGLCPSCGKRTVSWRYHPPEVVIVCDCSVAPGLVRADRLPVEPVTIR
jgi:DNA polymerase-1